MHGIIENIGCTLMVANGWVEHSHVLVIRKPKISESDLVRTIKANSSRWLRETWPEMKRFAWQDGFAAFSVSHSKRDEIRRYIEGQEQRHGEMSYQDEFLALLRKHDIAYDRRYVFDDDTVIAS
jgi:putative transposase